MIISLGKSNHQRRRPPKAKTRCIVLLMLSALLFWQMHVFVSSQFSLFSLFDYDDSASSTNYQNNIRGAVYDQLDDEDIIPQQSNDDDKVPETLITEYHIPPKIFVKEEAPPSATSWTALLTVTDGFYDFFLNWLAYYKQLSPPPAFNKLIIIAEDDAVLQKIQKLQQRGILPSAFQIERSELELTKKSVMRKKNEYAALSYESSNYNKLVSTRAGQILTRLQKGMNILYTDVDTVWLSNPLFYVDDPQYSDMDFIAQSDGIREGQTWYCTGFMAIRSNKRSIDLMKRWNAALQTPQLNQPVFNELVQKATRQLQLRHAALSLDEFPYGEMYFDYDNFIEKRSEVAVVHNNYIIGHDVKKERFMRHGLWMLDEKNSNPADTLVAPSSPRSLSTDGLILTLATTLLHTEPGTQKYYIQLNTLRALALLKDDINVVVFTKDATGERLCLEAGIKHVVKEFETNQYGTPYVKSIFEKLDNIHDSEKSTFLGYVNADILFDTRLIHSLKAISQAYTEGRLTDHILIVGRRTNVKMDDDMKRDDHPDMVIENNLDSLVDRFHEGGELFSIDAQDFFIITPGTFDWDEIPNLVIGRPGYDNWLVNYVYDKDDATLIDVTDTVPAIHQTGVDGDKASFQERDDTQWNWDLAHPEKEPSQYQHGYTTCASVRTIWGDDLRKDRILVARRNGRVC